MPDAKTIMSMIRELEDLFLSAGLEDARREARLLIAHVLDRPTVFIHANPDFPIDDGAIFILHTLARRRCNREPLAWVAGSVDFAGLTFSVAPGVLVPRPDSEILVETAMMICRKYLIPENAAAGICGPQSGKQADEPDIAGSPLRILDSCAGSGCIGISLAVCLEAAGQSVDLSLTELSSEALACAGMNLEKHGLAGRAHLFQTDLFPPQDGSRFDLIVANPPYIATEVIDTLMPEVSRHEPRLALDGGLDGLDVCRSLIAAARFRLNPSGWLLLEHGYDQAEQIAQLLAQEGYTDLLPAVADYGGQPRVSGGRMMDDPRTC